MTQVFGTTGKMVREEHAGLAEKIGNWSVHVKLEMSVRHLCGDGE